MFPLSQNAPAKLNLSLRLLGTRDDGYSNLHSLVGFLTLANTVSISDKCPDSPFPPLVSFIDIWKTLFPNHLPPAPFRNTQLGCLFEGPFVDKELTALPPYKNLLFKAFLHFLHQIPSNILNTLKIPNILFFHVVKNIPHGGGLGSGSADAAATLQLCHKLWPHIKQPLDMKKVAFFIGADVPICLYQKPAYLENIGDVITPLEDPLPPLFILLAVPKGHLSTKDVFLEQGKMPFSSQKKAPPLQFSSIPQLIDFLHHEGNDLQQAAGKLLPSVKETLDCLSKLKDQRFHSLTGSGRTCFALFETYKSAKEAQTTLKKQLPSLWSHICQWHTS